MKKNLILMHVALILMRFSNAQETSDYNNLNGTIIYQKTDTETQVTIRICELEVIIGDLATKEERVIYDSYVTKKIIANLKDNDRIKILQIYKILYVDQPKDNGGNYLGEVWYQIEFNSIIGWVCISAGYLHRYTDPYFNNRWEIMGVIQNEVKQWTVRRMDQKLAVFVNLNIRDNPGISGTRVLYTIKPNDKDPYQTNVDVIAMTEEVETIEGKTDHWIKIKYKDYEGWIFGGYTSVERGGPKYYIPEEMVEFALGWY